MPAGEYQEQNARDQSAPEPSDDDQGAVPRYAIHRSIWFRRRGAIPVPGELLSISEKGALARVERSNDRFTPPWPLYLRHGDEVWLYNVINEPLNCWVVAVERDVVRLRLFKDAGVLPDLRSLIDRFAIAETLDAGATKDSS